MKDVIFYNSYDIFVNEKNKTNLTKVPGGEAFSSYFKIFSQNITAVDRTGIISIPLNVHIPEHLQIPKFEKLNTTFEQICDNRARQLIELSQSKNKKLVVMYSGGIDSTLILCSLIKNCSKKELDNVIVLLSEISIEENINFFNNFVVKNFNYISSYRFPYILGNDDYLFVSGENADQLFGSQVNAEFAIKYNYKKLFESFDNNEGNIIDFFIDKIDNKKYAESVFQILKKLIDNAPVKINSIYHFFWWINFTTKWQNVYVRVLPYSMNKSTIKLEDNYTTFYSPKDFQLWAMNNTDLLTKEGSGGIKYVSKKYIYDVNGDEEYMNKVKIGSLFNMVKRKELIYTMDQNMNFSNEYPTEEYYNYGNDFEEMMK
jgi:hypothetical protein